ncbi:bifunctional ADP-dependent NAD(P)H-hydrate dehydratase/NAD(P)H-hydrate epimerase [Halobaculum gomorrense]|uniref:Bifunctional NAD(P)H-hydrate repair enzyme n=1 Tax=Halobaculum gomorrense TaxID=43928 RepID=A0A1M5R6L0_9EURY|nr:bifunctional ADP-dependent NAD(P)H-hydrate dehydratase/NAD(P)H-hydrate epimerase [Halobaculum gomorrense]SHH21868.1 NAD(P)H-hydrate epimerase [Halobaculum gomorrense]
MISSERMAMVDRNAAALGVSTEQLMESSGNAVARAVGERAAPDDRVLLVCGRGNNGGDAMVTARFLDEFETEALLLGRPETIRTDIARENWDALVESDLPARTITDSREFDLDEYGPDLVVDAMLGTGVTGALREPEATVARRLNAADVPIVSVDVPSGVDADTGEAAGTAVDADAVVTFHDDKPGLASLDCDVTVADIGIPDAAETFVGPGDLLALGRDADSHKGDNGEVLVVGGGPYTGAPALAARAALRAGADLVRVACPVPVAREIQGYGPDLIVRGFDGDRLAPRHVADLLDRAADQDTAVFGPGLGSDDATLEAVAEFLAGYDGRAVVDADALQVVPEVDTEAELICTPHQGELRTMGGETARDWRERADLVREFAGELGHTLLVKGRHDVISDGAETRVGRTGNPGMTVGGTGDVLAGVTGALAAQVDSSLQAAALAAWANGRAGDAAADEFGDGLAASDLPDRIPQALRDEGE